MPNLRYHTGKKVVLFESKVAQALPDINITPMIDVLLVLLVIFMAALPLNQRGLDIELPRPSENAPAQQTEMQVLLELTADKRLALNAEYLELSALDGRLRPLLETRKNKTVFIMAAGTLRYGDVVEVIDAAKGAGAFPIGLVTEGMRQANKAQPAGK